ncbi:MAG: S-ribosylhomocysteine lyase [Spirochaetales bacterium]|nr:S-ribosylhomocysteine lyase [Spirochaetales bacterium]
MEKIASFQIDHLRLLRGVYVSRLDTFGSERITTFDIRMKEPNREPVMDVPALHTLEHLGATFLRSHPVWAAKTVYFGPMGCRTGLYALFIGEHSSRDMLPLLKEFFQWVLDFQGDVPGAQAAECGNWQDHNLEMAQWEARKFLTEVLNHATDANLHYPA